VAVGGYINTPVEVKKAGRTVVYGHLLVDTRDVTTVA
jgi:hypothetical protein